MSNKFVRASKYRHAFGTASKRDQCYDNLKVSRSAWDTNLVSANQQFIAVNLEVGGGGAFAVIPHAQVGKLPDNLPVFNGHAAAVLDTDFNPFNDNIIASASEDCKAMVWTIPKDGLKESINTPTLTLSGHGRKVGHVLFNPVADNILATSSADMTVKIWDISTGQEKFELVGHAEIIQSISWSWQGNFLATACKDKKLRVFDVRSKKIAHEANGHQGVKGSRVVTMGDSTYFCSTGFSKTSDRQVFIWDTRNFATPIKQESIDTASGLLIPTYDSDTNMLYLAGKGDGNIRYFEWVEEDKNIYNLSEYKSSDPLRGLCFLPKRACNIADCEVARIYKVHPTFVEPISFKVPRKADGFQSDLFPNTVGGEPAIKAAEWLAGKTCGPKMVNLEHGYVAPAPKEFVTSGTAEPTSAVHANAPMSEKEYQDAYHALRKETDDLKSTLAARDAKIPGYSYSPYNYPNSEENQQQQPPQQHQTNGNYLPPLLLDALGGGKRPGKLGGPNHHSPNNPQSIFQSSHGQYHMSSAGGGNVSPGTMSSFPSTSNHHRTRSQRSRSRERSLTPGIFGSPSASASGANPVNDLDAPPSTMMMDVTPGSAVRQMKPPSLQFTSNNLSSSRDYQQQHQYSHDFSPAGSAMSVDARSSNMSAQGTPSSFHYRPFNNHDPAATSALKNPSTPASLSSTNGTTVTFIGFPQNKRKLVIEMAENLCGPIYHIKKPENLDSNWMIVTFLNVQSAERALQLLDGIQEGGAWVLCVKRGDAVGALSSGKKPNQRLESPRLRSSRLDDSPMIDSPLMQLKNQRRSTLILDEATLSVESSPVVTSVSRNSISTNLSHKNHIQSAAPISSSLYPSLPKEPAPLADEFSYEAPPSSQTPGRRVGGMVMSDINEAETNVAKPAGLLSKVADFLFGW